jgi:hypothetical protein
VECYFPAAFHDFTGFFIFLKPGWGRVPIFERVLEGWGWVLALAGAISSGVLTVVCSGACGSSYLSGLLFFFVVAWVELTTILFRGPHALHTRLLSRVIQWKRRALTGDIGGVHSFLWVSFLPSRFLVLLSFRGFPVIISSVSVKGRLVEIVRCLWGVCYSPPLAHPSASDGGRTRGEMERRRAA